MNDKIKQSVSNETNSIKNNNGYNKDVPHFYAKCVIDNGKFTYSLYSKDPKNNNKKEEYKTKLVLYPLLENKDKEKNTSSQTHKDLLSKMRFKESDKVSDPYNDFNKILKEKVSQIKIERAKEEEKINSLLSSVFGKEALNDIKMDKTKKVMKDEDKNTPPVTDHNYLSQSNKESKKNGESSIDFNKEKKTKSFPKEKATKALEDRLPKFVFEDFKRSFISFSQGNGEVNEKRGDKIKKIMDAKEKDNTSLTNNSNLSCSNKELKKGGSSSFVMSKFPSNTVRIINANIIYNNKECIKKKFILCNESNNQLLDKLIISNDEVMDKIILKQLGKYIKKFVLENSTKKGCISTLPLYYSIYKDDGTKECVPPLYTYLKESKNNKPVNVPLKNSIEESNYYISIYQNPKNYLNKYKGFIKYGKLNGKIA